MKALPSRPDDACGWLGRGARGHPCRAPYHADRRRLSYSPVRRRNSGSSARAPSWRPLTPRRCGPLPRMRWLSANHRLADLVTTSLVFVAVGVIQTTVPDCSTRPGPTRFKCWRTARIRKPNRGRPRVLTSGSFQRPKRNHRRERRGPDADYDAQDIDNLRAGRSTGCVSPRVEASNRLALTHQSTYARSNVFSPHVAC